MHMVLRFIPLLEVGVILSPITKNSHRKMTPFYHSHGHSGGIVKVDDIHAHLESTPATNCWKAGFHFIKNIVLPSIASSHFKVPN